ncbi:biotin--[acetyl-CoA-carboxylase] ligase [Methanoculleus sp. YWC-01]|uniref:Biotin--[acetyl-CoA-carboxylase] ligase n=1 Tax=Methanoculleus nereidis TaxID=2735141 RepID=A0ABU3Z312_9EURY|nr:biotin--[acetyl-CoA-carboxylase] ligase [Methanoculleus sp. YWC-01]MCK9298988.1 biotin--[acetyl-CoA-carboxylase] ligase [Methanoculleus sp.]MDV4343212.1 biotin--[acetyl-CoA-carboxylase] ligase [Methanoculleus sp. YWC-01]PKL54990.1 MAG: biotin--[acetyl-CoA-carboxylase] ligase [Methanomicrobiales archaeon HGW-Methanomicrobiales-6]
MKDTAINVLKILEESPGPVSGEWIAEQLGVTRSAVWKQIRELRRLGYSISSSRAEGYRLETKTDRLLPYEIRKQLRTRVIGRQIRHFDSTASTSWVAKKLADETDPEKLHGMVIIAEEQTGGVGRLGRAWVSPAGGIWATILLKPKIPLDHLFMITMAGSVAIARAIRKEYGISALIKWPNDIFIGDKKVAGLLLELSAEADDVHYALLGLGIDANVSLDELSSNLRDTVTTLQAEVGHTVDRVALLARVLREFELRYQQLEDAEYDSIIREWKSLSLTLDHRVAIKTVNKTFTGEAIDIDAHGALIIRKDNGKVERVIAGDCFQL